MPTLPSRAHECPTPLSLIRSLAMPVLPGLPSRFGLGFAGTGLEACLAAAPAGPEPSSGKPCRTVLPGAFVLVSLIRTPLLCKRPASATTAKRWGALTEGEHPSAVTSCRSCKVEERVGVTPDAGSTRITPRFPPKALRRGWQAKPPFRCRDLLGSRRRRQRRSRSGGGRSPPPGVSPTCTLAARRVPPLTEELVRARNRLDPAIKRPCGIPSH